MGILFASKFEAAVYQMLKMQVRAGEYKDLKCQVQVRLGSANILYKPDFSAVRVSTGETEYFEVKGFKTAIWAIKKRLWKAEGPGKLHIYEGRHNRFKLVETLEPNNERCLHCGNTLLD